MGHENGGAFNDDQKSGHGEPVKRCDWPEVYETCEECENPKLRGEECSHCEEEHARIDAAIDRLEAEVVQHQDDELVCSACGRPFALHGIECATQRAEPVEKPVENDGCPCCRSQSRAIPSFYSLPSCPICGHPGKLHVPGPRFGERLRDFIRDLPATRTLITLPRNQVAAMADAIDQDAAQAGYMWLDGPPWAAITGHADVEEFSAMMNLPAAERNPPTFGARLLAFGRDLELTGKPERDLRWVAHAINRDRENREGLLRQQLESLVEELRYSVQVSALWPAGQGPVKDILDVEVFLDRLPGIFGAREATTATTGPRIALALSVVDLRGIPEGLLWGNGREYRRVLDQTTEAGWSWLASTGCDSRLVGVGMLKEVPQ